MEDSRNQFSSSAQGNQLVTVQHTEVQRDSGTTGAFLHTPYPHDPTPRLPGSRLPPLGVS